jgi:hypothetical protein
MTGKTSYRLKTTVISSTLPPQTKSSFVAPATSKQQRLLRPLCPQPVGAALTWMRCWRMPQCTRTPPKARLVFVLGRPGSSREVCFIFLILRSKG